MFVELLTFPLHLSLNFLFLQYSLANQLPPELEQEECGSYQQQNSPPNKPTNESAGMITIVISLPLNVKSLAIIYLFTGAFAHGSKSSRITDTCIVSVVPSAVKAPPTEPAFHLGISSSVPNSLPSLVRMESFGTQSALAEPGHLQGQLKFDIRSTPSFHPHSLPECHDGLNKGVRCNSSGTKGANINIKPPEIIDSRHFSGVSSNGHSIGFTEGGKYNLITCCSVLSVSLMILTRSYEVPKPFKGYEIAVNLTVDHANLVSQTALTYFSLS